MLEMVKQREKKKPIEDHAIPRRGFGERKYAAADG
jgi:hypothetical protein